MYPCCFLFNSIVWNNSKYDRKSEKLIKYVASENFTWCFPKFQQNPTNICINLLSRCYSIMLWSYSTMMDDGWGTRFLICFWQLGGACSSITVWVIRDKFFSHIEIVIEAKRLLDQLFHVSCLSCGCVQLW